MSGTRALNVIGAALTTGLAGAGPHEGVWFGLWVGLAVLNALTAVTPDEWPEQGA